MFTCWMMMKLLLLLPGYFSQRSSAWWGSSSRGPQGWDGWCSAQTLSYSAVSLQIIISISLPSHLTHLTSVPGVDGLVLVEVVVFVLVKVCLANTYYMRSSGEKYLLKYLGHCGGWTQWTCAQWETPDVTAHYKLDGDKVQVVAASFALSLWERAAAGRQQSHRKIF